MHACVYFTLPRSFPSLNCFLIFELIAYMAIIILVFCVGIVITLGFTATCENLTAKAKKEAPSSSCATS